MALLQIIYKANYDKHSILLPKIEIKAHISIVNLITCDHILKRFSSLTLWANKLERLSLTSYLNLV